MNRWLIVVFPALFLLTVEPSAFATSTTDSSNHSPKDTLTIRNSGYFIVHDIRMEGNRVTKRHIILRELPFRTNDTISFTEWQTISAKAKENLLNASLFNFATVDTTNFTGTRASVTVKVIERWYTWPVPVFELYERNFNVWLDNPNRWERINYGFYLYRNNFRGRKEQVGFGVRLGYIENYWVFYNVPYLDNKQRMGLGFSFGYSRNHEINYGTLNNKPMYYKDPDDYVRQEVYGSGSLSYRYGIYQRHGLSVRYFKGTITDTATIVATDYYPNGGTRLEYLSAEYSYRLDHRDSWAYPLKGYYFDFTLSKLGLGILKSENINLLVSRASLRKYWKISGRFYSAQMLRLKWSSSPGQPYAVQRGLGYGWDYIRGYEYYVVDGQNFAMLRTGLRYNILKPHVTKIPFIKTEKFDTFHYAFYINTFFDSGYVQDDLYYQINPLANELLYGYGIGIDYVTYYDIALRVEYSFNKNFEQGFFLHLGAAF